MEGATPMPRTDNYATIANRKAVGYPEAQKPGPIWAYGQRKRINVLAIFQVVFGPWLLFSGLYATMSFSIHYSQPAIAWTIAAVTLLIVLASGAGAWGAYRRRMQEEAEDPTWLIFLFASLAFAWLLAMVFGDINFYQNMVPFYDVENLATYPMVDPSHMRGQGVMDFGRIFFQNDAVLDITRSAGFKNLDTYCVAPVSRMNPETQVAEKLSSYDFWAVGVNCCAGNQPDFSCGEFANPYARAGLRLMKDELRPWFRLAVEQAEAMHGIKAQHPLFLTWMQDPNEEVNAHRDNGMKSFLLGIFGHFSFQLFCVLCVITFYQKLQPR